jgi:hypothetical protein
MTQRADLAHERRRARAQGWLLAAVLVAFLALAFWYSVTIPLGEAPDEVPHFTYVRYLAQHGQLPATKDEHEAFQPPLYYAVGAALTFWIKDAPDAPFSIRANADYDPTDARAPKNLLLHTADEAWPYRGWALAWHIVRLFSIALGALTVWAVYRLGRLLFPAQPAIPLTMAALTAFTPQFLFMSAVVNNDNASVAISALILWRVAALLHAPECHRFIRDSIVIGVLLGLGMLSKANANAGVVVAGLAIVIAGLECRSPDGILLDHKRRARLTAGGLLVAGVLAAAIAGWYFARNWRLYGDPLGWSFLLQVNAGREVPLTFDELIDIASETFRSFWLGWIGISFDTVIYWLIGVACVLALAGFGVWLVRRWHELKAGARWSLVLLGLHAAIILGSWVQWSATVLGTDQGRLIYPLLPSAMLILVAGWAWWARGPRCAPVLAGLVTAMLCLALVTPTRYIAPVHGPAPIATQADLTAASPLNVVWDSVQLLGYRLESNTVEPGGKLILDLYWQGLQLTEPDWMALIQLVDHDGKFLMYTDGSPTAGRDTTDSWKIGVPLASRHLLPVPDYGQPGEYYLTIGLHPFGERTWISAVGPDGAPIGDQLTLPETIHVVAP